MTQLIAGTIDAVVLATVALCIQHTLLLQRLCKLKSIATAWIVILIMMSVIQAAFQLSICAAVVAIVVAVITATVTTFVAQTKQLQQSSLQWLWRPLRREFTAINCAELLMSNLLTIVMSTGVSIHYFCFDCVHYLISIFNYEGRSKSFAMWYISHCIIRQILYHCNVRLLPCDLVH